ncbi:uncharacterized protein LOC126897368 isoform X2 [Daktulosphaira vitifoliae]|uniref:uncharacterized protein LOC126897368 isoform X2 n=1 Tax=Daktulosphaira vitifoliae TaxID=58002 RepID=UPI0021AA153F|nr:uncharacterized protein LOC126897368 isoform X2 [Daktulosphaira vitifoliae]
MLSGNNTGVFHSKNDIDRYVQEQLKGISDDHEKKKKGLYFARMYFKISEFKLAEQYLTTYLTVNKNSLEGRRLLGHCYIQLGNKEKAINEFQKSLNINPNQPELLLTCCEILVDPCFKFNKNISNKICKQAEDLYPYHPVVHKLRDRLVILNNNSDLTVIEHLNAEILEKPNDTYLKIKLLKLLVNLNRLSEAFNDIVNVEKTMRYQIDNIEWYLTASQICESYGSSYQVNWEFYTKVLPIYEHLISLKILHGNINAETKLNDDIECYKYIYRLDQALYQAKKLPSAQTEFYRNLINHMSNQLYFYLGCLIMKSAKLEQNLSWHNTNKLASFFFIMSLAPTVDKNAFDNEFVNDACKERKSFVALLEFEGIKRIIESGFILRSMVSIETENFIESIKNMYSKDWKLNTYKKIFIGVEQPINTTRSFFIKYSPEKLIYVIPEFIQYALPKHISSFEMSRPSSLHHLVWYGLQLLQCESKGSEFILTKDAVFPVGFCCNGFNEVPLVSKTILSLDVQTISLIDINTFLYAAVFTAASILDSNKQKKGIKYFPTLPSDITELLTTHNQENWWKSVHEIYSKNNKDSSLKNVISYGLGAVRLIDNHGLDAQLIVHLAKNFVNQCNKVKNNHIFKKALEIRAVHYWKVAVQLLERIIHHGIEQRPKNALFEFYRKVLTLKEVSDMLEEGKFYLACHMMKNNKNEEAVELFKTLKSPYASFHQALIYKKKLKSDIGVSNSNSYKFSTITLLAKIKELLNLTKERLKDNPHHPLNYQVKEEILELKFETDVYDIEKDSMLDSGEEFLNDINILNKRCHINFSYQNNTSTPNSTSQKFMDNSKISQRFLVEDSILKVLNELTAFTQSQNIQNQTVCQQYNNLMEKTNSISDKVDRSFEQLTKSIDSISNKINDLSIHFSKYSIIEKFIEKFNEFEVNLFDKINILNKTIHVHHIDDLCIHSIIEGLKQNTLNANSLVSPCVNTLIKNDVVLNQSNEKLSNPIIMSSDSGTIRSSSFQYLPSKSEENLDSESTLDSNLKNLNMFKFSLEPSLNKSELLYNIKYKENNPITEFKPAIQLPDKTKECTGEENDTILFQCRAKLYKYTDKKWKEKGIGILKISRNNNSNKVRLVMRRDQVLKVCANHYLYQDMKLKVKNDKAVLWIANDFSDSVQTQLEYLCARFKTVDDCKEFIKTFNDSKQLLDLNTSSIKSSDLCEKNNSIELVSDEHTFSFPPASTIIYKPEIKVNIDKWMNGHFSNFKFFKPSLNNSGASIFNLPVTELSDDLKIDFSKKSCVSLPKVKSFEIENLNKKSSEPNSTKIHHLALLGSPLGKTLVQESVLEKSQHSYEESEVIVTEKTNIPIDSLNEEITDENTLNKKKKTYKFNLNFTPNSDKIIEISDFRSCNTNLLTSDCNSSDFSNSSGDISQVLDNSKNSSNILLKSSTLVDDNVLTIDKEKEDLLPTVKFIPVISLPKKIDVVTGEERLDVFFDDRAKLLRFDPSSKEWKERGVGQIKILYNSEHDYYQILMRRENIFKICCNQRLTADLNLKPIKSCDKAMSWIGQDFSDGESKKELFAIKFKTINQLNKFKKIFDEVKKEKSKNSMFISYNNETKSDKSTEINNKLNTQNCIQELPKLNNLNQFKLKPGSWICEECYLYHETSIISCPACKTKKSGSTLNSKSDCNPSNSFSYELSIFTSPSKLSVSQKNSENIGLPFQTKFEQMNKTTVDLIKQPKQIEEEIKGKSQIKCSSDKNKKNSHDESDDVKHNAQEFKAESDKFQLTPSNENDDIQFIEVIDLKGIIPYEDQIVAENMKLPLSFFLYKLKPDCKGCIGCYKDNDEDLVINKIMSKVNYDKDKENTNVNEETLIDITDINKTSTDDLSQIFPLESSLFDNECLAEIMSTKTDLSKCDDVNISKTDKKESTNVLFEYPTSIIQSNLPPILKSASFFFCKTDNITSENVLSFGPKIDNSITFQQILNDFKPIFGQNLLEEKKSDKCLSKINFYNGKSNFKNVSTYDENGDGIKDNGEKKQQDLIDNNNFYFKPKIHVTFTSDKSKALLFCGWSQLFQKENVEYKEKGTGHIKILHHQDHKIYRLLFEREKVSEAVCNHLITSDMMLIPVMIPNKVFCWSCINTSDNNNKVAQKEILAVSFESDDWANKFKDIFDDCVSKLSNNIQ